MKCICDGHVPSGLAGFEPGVTPLGVFRPPAPQDYQMRAAQLHQFAGVQPTVDCLSCDPVAEAMRTFKATCLRTPWSIGGGLALCRMAFSLKKNLRK